MQVVLIHKFFSCSTFTKWRLMYGVMEAWGLLSQEQLQSSSTYAHPAFDPKASAACR